MLVLLARALLVVAYNFAAIVVPVPEMTSGYALRL